MKPAGSEGTGVDVPDCGSCWFTSAAAGDFAEPSGAQLDGLAGTLGLDGRAFSRSHQVHGRSVRMVGSPEAIVEGDEHDGQLTTSRKVICAVRTADCLPVALISSGAAGIVHAGWRGLVAGVLVAGMEAMGQAGNSPVTAVIGPGVRVCCYEAGPEVHAAFAPAGPRAREGANANLPWIAARQLEAAGVAEVVDLGLCTICSTDPKWHSYRRDGEDAGRSLALAWRS